jgi:hypothetical protein
MAYNLFTGMIKLHKYYLLMLALCKFCFTNHQMDILFFEDF